MVAFIRSCMEQQPPSRLGSVRKVRLGRTVPALAVIVAVAAAFIFLFIGSWLVVEDPLQKASAIAILSGGMPARAREAAELYRKGYAPKILVTHPSEPAEALAAIGVSYVSEDAYDVQILLRQGVPRDAVQIIAPAIRNTADEISAISDALGPDTTQSVIIVTSKVHTRRARILWRRLAKGRHPLVVHGVSDDPFRPRHWWATSNDALDVVRELLGILNAWAGLPLRPTR